MTHNIVFTIEHDDIIDFDADVIALKYAQKLYGADKVVADALSQAGIVMHFPKIDDYRYVNTHNSIRTNNVLFVGVPHLSQFEYQEIQEFAIQVLDVLSREAPTTKHLAMTIHGPGYGLDEIEAALAQFAGYLIAIKMGKAPSDLKCISLVERNSNRVKRLRQAFELNLRINPYAARLLSPKWGYKLAIPGILDPKYTDISTLEKTEKESEAKPHIFVAMPFRKDMDDVFYYGIQGPVHAAGFLCERVDQEAFTGDILDRVKKRIETASLVIAELTGSNPNVYLEVGYAWGKGRSTILLVKETQELLFDVRGHRCLKYERIKDLEEQLTKELGVLKYKNIF